MTEFLELIKNMNDKIETLEKEVLELKGHKDNGLNLNYSNTKASVEKVKGKWNEGSNSNKGLTINNEDGSTFAIMSGGEIVVPGHVIPFHENIRNIVKEELNKQCNDDTKKFFKIVENQLKEINENLK